MTFDYFPPCKGSRDRWGQQQEPDEPASVDIAKIMLGGFDIYDVTAEFLHKAVEEQILEQLFEEDRAAADAAAEKASEERTVAIRKLNKDPEFAWKWRIVSSAKVPFKRIKHLEKWCEENPIAYWGEAMDILNEAKGGFWDVRERENCAEHESVEVDVDQETGVFIDRWERTK